MCFAFASRRFVHTICAIDIVRAETFHFESVFKLVFGGIEQVKLGRICYHIICRTSLFAERELFALDFFARLFRSNERAYIGNAPVVLDDHGMLLCLLYAIDVFDYFGQTHQRFVSGKIHICSSF